MSCPFAKTCPTFEAFAHEGTHQHLAWAFCWGEYRDCDRYKCTVTGERCPRELGSGVEAGVLSKKDKALSKLRAILFDPPARI
jgi:hypothetical protein